MVEEKADQILSEARTSDVAFLVVGDAFGYEISVLVFVIESCIFLTDSRFWMIQMPRLSHIRENVHKFGLFFMLISGRIKKLSFLILTLGEN